MHWEDDCLVIDRKSSSEGSIVSVLTAKYGVCSAYLRVRAQKLTFGARLRVRWSARVSSQLGSFTILQESPLSWSIIDDIRKLNLILSMCEIIKITLPNNEPNFEIFQKFDEIVALMKISGSGCDDNGIIALYIAFEMEILKVIGFEIDLSCCAASGDVYDSLEYISPKTGRGVSGDAGLIYKDHLFKITSVIYDIYNRDNKLFYSDEEVCESLRITGFFLNKFLGEHSKQKLLIRSRVLKLLLKPLDVYIS